MASLLHAESCFGVEEGCFEHSGSPSRHIVPRLYIFAIGIGCHVATSMK